MSIIDTPTIELRSGGLVDLSKIQPSDIRLDDIAHSLSNLCRFNGHCREFYSVAQHSVHVLELVSRSVVLVHANPFTLRWALLHDSAEAYLGDITGLLKQILLEESPVFVKLEQQIEDAVMSRFRIDPTKIDFEAIKEADQRILLTEKRDLMGKIEWPGITDTTRSRIPNKIVPQQNWVSKEEFLKSAERLKIK